MRCRVKHPAGVDSVRCGEVGEFADNAAVRAYLAAGLLELEGEGEGPGAPVAGGPRHDELVAALVARDARITELEVEVAQLRLDLEAATAPAKPTEG